jgi:N-methylhydantoinase B
VNDILEHPPAAPGTASGRTPPAGQMPPGQKTADPVTTEIVRNGLVAITEEMKINLMRTAYNMIIYEALDFTVGLFDAEGNTVSIGSKAGFFNSPITALRRLTISAFSLATENP